MVKMASALKEKLERDPRAIANVIVMVQGESSAYASQVSALGLTIKRSFTLIPGLAVSGPASAILALANESWVKSIEEDKPVHTMGGKL